MDELTTRRDEGRRLLIATRWFQVSVLAVLLANLVGAVEGWMVPGLMDAEGELPGWIGWVMTPRYVLGAFHDVAILVGIVVIARVVSFRAFGFWGVVFTARVLIMVTGGMLILAETMVGALSGTPARPPVWLSFVPGWFWSILAIAASIAGAVCALRLSRRWDGGLSSPIRVWLLAAGAIALSAGFEVNRYFRDASEPESTTSSGAMAILAALALLAIAWQIWLLIELQRAARRLKRPSH